MQDHILVILRILYNGIIIDSVTNLKFGPYSVNFKSSYIIQYNHQTSHRFQLKLKIFIETYKCNARTDYN